MPLENASGEPLELDGEPAPEGCSECCTPMAARFFFAQPCIIEGIGGGTQNEPCNRPPFAVVYVRADVVVGAAPNAETIAELVARYAALAGGGIIGGADGSNRRLEIGFVWAGQCYTISSTQTFDLPSELQAFVATGRTDVDPYTSDVIVPLGGAVRLLEVAPSVIPAGGVGAFCSGCLSGIRYCAAYACSGQAVPGGVRSWVCAAVVGAIGNTFEVGGVCYCVDCSQQIDLVELINIGERNRVLDVTGSRTFGTCTECLRFFNPGNAVELPCADGSICLIERPCVCGYSGSATVTDVQIDSNDARFSYYISRAFRVLADGTIEDRQLAWFETSTPDGPPDDETDWRPVGTLAGQDRLPVCDGRWCRRIPGEPGSPGDFDTNQGPLGGAVPGSDHYRGFAPPGIPAGFFFGSAQCQVACTQGSYGWSSGWTASENGVTRTVTSLGLVTVSCQCAGEPVVSECTRPAVGSVPGVPGDAALPLDPLADGP